MIVQNTLYLRIVKAENNEFKISTGTVKDFISDHTIIIGEKNPNLLWNLLSNLAGLPLPVLVDPQKVIMDYLEKNTKKLIEPSIETIPQKEIEISPIEKELSALKASEIVSKVFAEKGIQITNSLKSKSAIIKKALKIYEK